MLNEVVGGVHNEVVGGLRRGRPDVGPDLLLCLLSELNESALPQQCGTDVSAACHHGLLITSAVSQRPNITPSCELIEL